jgi:hypothetical protein
MSHRMKLSVTRLDGQGRYETMIVRDDGVRFMLKGHDCAVAMPHDIAHYVVEQALGLARGFWGRVAAGGVFPSMSYVDGRRKPKAAERSKSVLKGDPDELADAEVLVRIFSDTILEGHDETAPILTHRLKDRRMAQKRTATTEEIAAVFARYRDLRARWSDLPVGGSIELRW